MSRAALGNRFLVVSEGGSILVKISFKGGRPGRKASKVGQATVLYHPYLSLFRSCWIAMPITMTSIKPCTSSTPPITAKMFMCP